MLKKVINYSFLSYFPGQTSAIKKNLLDLSVGKTHVQLRQKSDSRENKMRLPVGYDDFRAVIENNLTFVDKSMFVKDIIDDSSQVILITRPRRFGKTINMSLLNYFFAEQILQRKTQGLFDSLKIANEPKYMSLQGKYPVVSLTLKDVKGAKRDELYYSLAEIVKKLYQEHRFLLEENKLHKEEEKQYQAILEGNASRIQIQKSLQSLTQYLYRSSNATKVMVLIDEYDSPILESYLKNHYDETLDLMREFLSPALKSNVYLQKAVLTGVLRVAKESLFSGLNNLKVYSLLDARYAEYFGFTEEEVNQLLNDAGLSQSQEEIKAWYNGYQTGNNTIIYNPWSIANCIQEKGLLKPYWINTSDNFLVKSLLINSSVASKERFRSLLDEQNITATIDDSFVFTELKENESALWSLLLMTGYLKANSQELSLEGLKLCQLAIPNLEVKGLYRRFVKEWLANGRGIQWYNDFLDRLLSGDINTFEKDMEQIMLQTASVHDIAREPEAFYQGFMLGLTVIINKDYHITSNRESGHGRYDIAIIPKDPSKKVIIFELKSVDATKLKKNNPELIKASLEEAASKALAQINTRNYVEGSGLAATTPVCKIGLAFSGKYLKVSYESIDPAPEKNFYS